VAEHGYPERTGAPPQDPITVSSALLNRGTSDAIKTGVRNEAG
jgi:hypothetical protein